MGYPTIQSLFINDAEFTAMTVLDRIYESLNI